MSYSIDRLEEIIEEIIGKNPTSIFKDSLIPKEKVFDFVVDTATVADRFSHVLNPEQKVSESFKSYAQTLSDLELTNINYIRISTGTVCPLERLNTQPLGQLRLELKKALHILKLHDGEDAALRLLKICEILNNKKAGSPKQEFCLLQQECFTQLANIYTKHTHLKPSFGNNSLFVKYVERCSEAFDGQRLANIRKLAKQYLNNR